MWRAWLAAALVACGNGNGSGGSAGSAAGSAAPQASTPRDQVIALWKKGGLDVSPFAPATSSVGADCASGTVAKLDVLICNLASADEAKRAADAGLTWIGSTTGASQARGSAVIVAADRHKADPNGRTIDQLFKLVPN